MSLRAAPAGAARAFFAPAEPNLVRGDCALRYGMVQAGDARLVVFDAAGRVVRALLAGVLDARDHAIRWDGRDDDGRALSEGLYFARLETPDHVATRRLARID